MEEPDQFINANTRYGPGRAATDEEGGGLPAGRVGVFDAYVFEKGEFELDGDGGFQTGTTTGAATGPTKWWTSTGRGRPT
ncbi:hypothetical protein DSC45_03020 [Streptomyces sp. YIM 130001]|uniref:hypothetical protein n=1 Tax=Streptomyces sp. YIM 130001 TaxID=2259644 RepID=UPI000E65399F|nr:hypothetical protein [Streptomyces sp. YIM 130001]RII20794.1 hypothetical protein DSC45_03020 [Streptomyces sp. YIM 130001]